MTVTAADEVDIMLALGIGEGGIHAGYVQAAV
jgi:hypothetical protein